MALELDHLCFSSDTKFEKIKPSLEKRGWKHPISSSGDPLTGVLEKEWKSAKLVCLSDEYLGRAIIRIYVQRTQIQAIQYDDLMSILTEIGWKKEKPKSPEPAKEEKEKI